jgi:hypothetical protein
VAYIPSWESLADALKRVIAADVSENEDKAKLDLCRAVADRKINVRVRIAPTDHGRRGQLFSDGNVGVPAHLKPDDLDWAKSCPFAQWEIGPRPGEHYAWNWAYRPLDLIELSTADVIEILCSGTQPHSRPQRVRGKARPALECAQIAIKAVYSNRLPDQATVQNKILCRRVGDKLKELKLREVSDDTILRAAGRRK